MDAYKKQDAEFYNYYKQVTGEKIDTEKGIWETVKSILSYINPFSENFFAYKLIDLLIDALKAMFKFLFIPSEERFTALTETVTSKFGFIDTIKEVINSIENILNNTGNSPKLSMDVDSKYYSGEVTYLDFSWYSQFKPYGDVVLTGFIYLIFVWRLFAHAPGIIQGSSGLTLLENSHDDWGNDV